MMQKLLIEDTSASKSTSGSTAISSSGSQSTVQ